MLVGFSLGCALIHAAGGQPLAVMRPSTNMAALQTASRFSPVQPLTRLQPLRASMPQHEEHAVVISEPRRREVLANFARAAAVGLGAASLKDARAEESEVTPAPAPTPPPRTEGDISGIPRDAFAPGVLDAPSAPATPATAATPAPEAPADSRIERLKTLAAVPAVAVGWVGFNILGPAFNQLGTMAEEKETKSNKKKR